MEKLKDNGKVVVLVESKHGSPLSLFKEINDVLGVLFLQTIRHFL